MLERLTVEADLLLVTLALPPAFLSIVSFPEEVALFPLSLLTAVAPTTVVERMEAFEVLISVALLLPVTPALLTVLDFTIAFSFINLSERPGVISELIAPDLFPPLPLVLLA